MPGILLKVCASSFIAMAALSGCESEPKTITVPVVVTVDPLPLPAACRTSGWTHFPTLQATSSVVKGGASLTDAATMIIEARHTDAKNYLRALRCECQSARAYSPRHEQAEIEASGICSSNFLAALEREVVKTGEQAKKAKASK